MAAATQIKRSIMENMNRLLHLKLLIPLRRSPHSSEYDARGVAVGMFWALTPLVGIQMYSCFMTWLILKPAKSLHFSLVISCAWTWVTNVFTMLPIYYVFYATGQIILGRWDNITGYETFLGSWDQAFVDDAGIWQASIDLLGLLAQEIGISMALGCLPFAIFGAWISYTLSLKYIRRRRRKGREKRARRKAVLAQERPNV